MHGVVEISKTAGHMTEAEYDRERAKIAKTRAEAGVRWEQELARLFAISGWSHGNLAKKEGITRQAISRYLKFGEFLTFIGGSTQMGANTEFAHINERTFRKFWDTTKPGGGMGGRLSGLHDRERFREVAQLIRQEPGAGQKRKTPISREAPKTIIKKLGDGRWHSPSRIAEVGNIQGHEVTGAMDAIRKLSVHRAHVETKRVGKELHYRIFKQDKTVSVDELTEKLAPLIQRLEAEGKKSAVTTIPAEVRMIAALLQRLLDEWAE
jgi:hypothetical protein